MKQGIRGYFEQMEGTVHPKGSRCKCLMATIVASTAIHCFSRHAGADATATWIGASGNWTDPTQWSTNPSYPNNGSPIGTNYQALIDLPGTYTVTSSSNVSVDALTIDSANATVSDTAGTLTVGGMTVSAGAFDLAGGTLSGGSAGATIALNPSLSLQVNGGTLDNLSFTGGGISAQFTSLTITNGLNMNGQGIALGDSEVTFDGGSQTLANTNFGNYPFLDSTIYLGGPSSAGPMTLTLDSQTTCGSGSTFRDGGTVAGDTLVNNGLMYASYGPINISTSNFTNNGTIQTNNGGSLYILSQNWTNEPTGVINLTDADNIDFQGNWTNLGKITVSDYETVLLGGNFTTAGIGDYEPSGGTFTYITGTLDNTGNMLNLTAPTGYWVLNNGGTIKGGTVALDGMVVADGTLSGVSVASGSSVLATSYLVMSGGTIAGTVNSYGTLVWQGTQFTSTGILQLYGTKVTAANGLNVGEGTLTGSGTINGNVTLASDPSTLGFQLRDDTDYDSLTINGNVSLNGNLQITLANGFLPLNSDVFTVLDVNSADNLTGSFLNVPDGGTLETADGSGYFIVEYADIQFPNEIVLTDFQQIPEPASAGMLCLIAAGSLMRRRRTNQSTNNTRQAIACS
jgi:fibronectin-binding autotransporter adhesin